MAALWAIETSNAQPLSENQQTKKTVETFFSAFGEKNPDKIASLVSEDVDWYIFESEDFPWTGKRSKRYEIPKVFATLFSYFTDGKTSFKWKVFLWTERKLRYSQRWDANSNQAKKVLRC